MNGMEKLKKYVVLANQTLYCIEKVTKQMVIHAGFSPLLLINSRSFHSLKSPKMVVFANPMGNIVEAVFENDELQEMIKDTDKYYVTGMESDFYEKINKYWIGERVPFKRSS